MFMFDFCLTKATLTADSWRPGLLLARFQGTHQRRQGQRDDVQLQRRAWVKAQHTAAETCQCCTHSPAPPSLYPQLLLNIPKVFVSQPTYLQGCVVVSFSSE